MLKLIYNLIKDKQHLLGSENVTENYYLSQQTSATPIIPPAKDNY